MQETVKVLLLHKAFQHTALLEIILVSYNAVMVLLTGRNAVICSAAAAAGTCKQQSSVSKSLHRLNSNAAYLLVEYAYCSCAHALVFGEHR